jgi:hypothetical protein
MLWYSDAFSPPLLFFGLQTKKKYKTLKYQHMYYYYTHMHTQTNISEKTRGTKFPETFIKYHTLTTHNAGPKTNQKNMKKCDAEKTTALLEGFNLQTLTSPDSSKKKVYFLDVGYRCPKENASMLVLLSALHPRLGADSPIRCLPHMVMVDICKTIYPKNRWREVSISLPILGSDDIDVEIAIEEQFDSCPGLNDAATRFVTAGGFMTAAEKLAVSRSDNIGTCVAACIDDIDMNSFIVPGFEIDTRRRYVEYLASVLEVVFRHVAGKTREVFRPLAETWKAFAMSGIKCTYKNYNPIGRLFVEDVANTFAWRLYPNGDKETSGKGLERYLFRVITLKSLLGQMVQTILRADWVVKQTEASLRSPRRSIAKRRTDISVATKRKNKTKRFIAILLDERKATNAHAITYFRHRISGYEEYIRSKSHSIVKCEDHIFILYKKYEKRYGFDVGEYAKSKRRLFKKTLERRQQSVPLAVGESRSSACCITNKKKRQSELGGDEMPVPKKKRGDIDRKTQPPESVLKSP